MTKKEKTLEELTNEKDQIRAQLDALKASAESAKSADEKKEVEEINKRINDLKKEISEKLKSSDISDEDREKLQQLDNELTPFTNELSSLKTAILSKTEKPETPAETTTSTPAKEEKGVFGKAWDWTKDQWNNVRDGEKWKEEPRKNGLRTAGFVATGVGALSLAYKGIKKLFGKDKKKGKEKSKEKKSFWQKPFGKFLKGSAITAGIVGGVYALGKSCGWWHSNPELETPSTGGTQTPTDTGTQTPTETPDDKQGGGQQGGSGTPQETPSGNEGKEKQNGLAPVEPAVMSDSLLKYFDDNVSLIKIKGQEREKIKNDLLNYFSAHPILKVDKNSNMTFKIDDKPAFEQMLRNMIENLKQCVGALKRAGINKIVGKKLDNVGATVEKMSKKEFEKISLKYLGGIVKEVAVAKNANLTIGNFFDSVAGAYSNGHSGEIRAELNSKGVAQKDIKTTEYPF